MNSMCVYVFAKLYILMQSLKFLNKKVFRLVSILTKMHCNFSLHNKQRISFTNYIRYFFALFLEHENICCNRIFLRATQCQVHTVFYMTTHSFYATLVQTPLSFSFDYNFLSCVHSRLSLRGVQFEIYLKRISRRHTHRFK